MKRSLTVAGSIYLVLAISGGVALLSTPDVAPLVAESPWVTTTGFEPAFGQPPAWDRRPGYPSELHIAIPGPAAQAVLVSAPFVTPDVVVVPYRLVNTDPIPLFDPRLDASVSIELECLDSSSVVTHPLAETNDRLAESVLPVPDGFCSGGESRIVARVSHPFGLTVGSPGGADSRFLASRQLPAHVFRHAVVFMAIALVGAAGALLAARRKQRSRAAVGFLLMVAAVSYAGFFFYYGSAGVGRAFSVLVLVAPGIAVAVAVRARPSLHGATIRTLAEPMGAWFLASLFFVLLLWAVDTGGGPWQANSRFWPSTWSSDNNLPMAVSEGLYRGESLDGILGGTWNVSDRPPLQAGMGTVLRPLVRLTAPGGAPVGQDLAYFHHTVGVVMNALWVLALVELTRALQWGRQLRHATCVIVGLSPIVIFNSTFVWPKLLAAAFAVGAFAVLIRASRHPPASRVPDLILVGALGAMSLLSHGGTVFFLIALALALPLLVPRLSLRAVSAAAITAVLLVAPWTAWQRIEDPPGTALIKYSLAGTFGFDEPDQGVLQTVVESYRELGLTGWLELKRDGVEQILGTVGWPMMDEGLDWPERRRLRELNFIAHSLGALSFAVLLVGARRWVTTAVFARARTLVLLGLGGLAVNLLVFWGPHVMHHLSYASLLILIAGASVGAYAMLGRWANLLVLPAVGLSSYVWIVDPLTSVGTVDPWMAFAVVGIGLPALFAVLAPLAIAPQRTTASVVPAGGDS